MFSHLSTITSQYLGSNSINLACLPVFSQAINVEPEPPNKSNTISLPLELFTIASSGNSTGFCVG